MAAPWTILLEIEGEVPIKGQSEGQDEFGQKRIEMTTMSTLSYSVKIDQR